MAIDPLDRLSRRIRLDELEARADGSPPLPRDSREATRQLVRQFGPAELAGIAQDLASAAGFRLILKPKP